MAGKCLIFRFADVEAHEREFSLVKAGETLAVEPKAFRVLLILLRNPKKLIPKEELLNAVWGDAAVTENSLTRAIALLRRLLGDDAREPRFIETVTSVGYRWLCPVERVEDPSGVSAVEEADEATDAASAGTPSAPVTAKTAGGRRWTWTGAAGAAALLLCAGFWYLHRPLPSPRIAAYTQITHDGRAKLLAATDGARLYFTQSSPSSIEQVSVTGGEIVELPIRVPGYAVTLEDISPDGSNALVVSYGESGLTSTLWDVRILGGTYKRLAEAESGAFSPDGSSVVCATLQGDLFTIRTDGTGMRKLIAQRSAGAHPRWSPDGRTIRFASDGRLWEISAEGSAPHPLLQNWKFTGTQHSGQWTRNGEFYLFVVSGTRSGEDQIWTLDERHGPFRQVAREPIQLTTGPVHWENIVPSTDGSRIFATGKILRGELSRIDPKTGRPEPFLGGISAESVSYSHDGNSLAYVTFPGGSLWKANCDGSNAMQLTDPPALVLNPRWSPDDKQILYIVYTGDSFLSYIVPSAGGSPHKLIPADIESEGDPNWSPDGKKVVFASGDIARREKEELRVLELETGQVTAIPDSIGTFSTRWSSDGKYIAALGWQEPVLRVFDVSGQRWFTPDTHGDVDWPAFSRDNRFIYFFREGRDQAIFRVRVPDGVEERVVDLRNMHLTGLLQFWMSLDPSDSPLVTRDTGTDDIYALTFEEK